MKYYHLSTPSDPKIIGVKNGIYQAEIDKKKYASKINYDLLLRFFSGIGWFERPHEPDFEVEIHANLLKSAIKTDVLQITPDLMACPFVINEKVEKILSKFKIQNYVFYPATIYSNKNEIDDSCKLFFTEYLDFDIIDFPKSIFYSGNKMVGKKFFLCQNLEEYKTRKKELTIMMGLEKLALNEKFDKELDFFNSRLGGMFVSERLKNTLIAENITGIVFKDNDPEVIVN